MKNSQETTNSIHNRDNIKTYFFISFIIVFVIYLIKYEIFWNGTGYYESASVLFHEAYFNSLWDGLHKLDNGYLPWLQMLLAYLIYGVFGVKDNFFIFAQLIVGVFISASCATINLRYFRIYIYNDLTRLSISIFIAIYLIYGAKFGEFTFFHNFSQALLPTAILYYLAVPTQHIRLVKLIPIFLFLVILVNSKPYYAVFFPLGILGLLYARYIAKSRDAFLFYIFVMLATLIQMSVMYYNRGTGLNNIIISDYSLADGLKDSITYCLATYTFYIFSPALAFFNNFHLFYKIGFTFTILMLLIYTVYLYKMRQFKKIYLLIGLNLAALGSLFITLYTATGLLTFPRYVLSLDGFIPLLNTRHFLVSNFAILMVLIMGLDAIFDIAGLNRRSVTLDNALRFAVVATSMRLMLVASSVAMQDNWFHYQNTEYITYHSPADWITEFGKYSSKDKPFLVINGSEIYQDKPYKGTWGISDFSRGVTWVDLLGTLRTSFDTIKETKYPINRNARSFKLLGAVGIPNPQDSLLMQTTQPQEITSNIISSKSIANPQITAQLHEGELRVLQKNYMIWPGDNSRYITTPDNLVKNLYSLLENKYKFASGSTVILNASITCEEHRSLFVYYQKPDNKYKITFRSNTNNQLTQNIDPSSPYERLRNSYVLPTLQFLEGYPPNGAAPIGWINVPCSKLKNWNGTVELEPVDNNKATISVVTRVNGELFTRLSDEVTSVILYNKPGEVVGKAVSVRDPGKPYKYFLLDQPAIGAEMVTFLNRQNQQEPTNIKMLWFGLPCPQCANEPKQPNNNK